MKSVIRSALAAVGLEVRRTSSVTKAWKEGKQEDLLRPWRQLAHYAPRTILDIGANDGFSVRLFRQIFPQATILSFEPLADCFRKVETALQDCPPGRAWNCALGDIEETTTIHRSEFSPSSSLLPMDELHRSEFPQTSRATEERIQVRRLDDLKPELGLQTPLLVKIDVQGFEDRVIQGGSATLQLAAAIVVELSAYTLYKGQATFSGVHSQLEQLGFVFCGTIDQMHSPKDGRILQFDGLFENTRLH